MSRPESTVADQVRSRIRGTVLTVQPSGNHGDTLIYLGMEKLLDERGVPWVGLSEGAIRNDTPREFRWRNPVRVAQGLLDRLTYVRHRFDRRIGGVYIHGGGNFNDLWGLGVRCFRTVSRIFDGPIVVGPQSCQFGDVDPRSIFEGVRNDVLFFCRERYSYDLMQEVAANCPCLEVALADDTALHLVPDDLPLRGLSNEYRLLAFRSDRESAGPVVHDRLVPPVRVRDISVQESTLEAFVNVVARAERVHTDRLHVAILAVLLGKSLDFYDNVYHKNRGVHEHSLSRYPDVTFHRLW